MSASIPPPTLFEKLDLIPSIFSLVGAALYATAAAPFRGESGADTVKHHVTHSVMRKALSRLNTAQLQFIAPSFSTLYSNWCTANNVTPELVTLKSGCKAFWVGDKAAKNVVVYYHGGGFSLDGGEEHIKWWHHVQTDLVTGGKSVAFLFLEYTLVPHGTYPLQLREGVEAIQYVLDQGHSSSEIILAGDSAGGNMCLAMLSHIMHPSSELPKLQIEKPLKALVLVAPWVSFRLDFPSADRNAYKDIVTKSIAATWSGAYLGGKKSDFNAEALDAPVDWWKDAKVEQVLTVAGADELLLDPISEWVEKFKSANPDKITYVVGKNEIHIAPIVEPRLGDSAPTEQGDAIKSWLKARL